MTAIPDQTIREALMGLGYVDPQHQTFEAVEEDATLVYWDGWGEGQCPQGPMIRTDLASLLKRCEERSIIVKRVQNTNGPGPSGMWWHLFDEVSRHVAREFIPLGYDTEALVHALAALYRSTQEMK